MELKIFIIIIISSSSSSDSFPVPFTPFLYITFIIKFLLLMLINEEIHLLVLCMLSCSFSRYSICQWRNHRCFQGSSHRCHLTLRNQPFCVFISCFTVSLQCFSKLFSMLDQLYVLLQICVFLVVCLFV